MILKIFAVRDQKTDQFGNPMFLTTKGQAIRSFSDEVNNKENGNMLNKHPGDFELYELGEYETNTGTFAATQPKSVVTAAELVNK